MTKQVESGQLKLVDERRSLAEVSQLKRSKKGFSEIASVQAAIDADKEKLAGVRKQLDDPETKSLSQAYTDIKTKMDALRVEQDDAYKGIKQLRDARDALQKKRDEAWEKKKGLGDEYYSKLNAFRAYDREQRQKHQQKIKLEREQQAAAKRKAEAEKRLREASFPAFADEITTCENVSFARQKMRGANIAAHPLLQSVCGCGEPGRCRPACSLRQAAAAPGQQHPYG